MIKTMTRVLFSLYLAVISYATVAARRQQGKIYTNEKQKHCRKVKLDVYEKQKIKNTYEYDCNTIILELCVTRGDPVYTAREREKKYSI